MNILVTGAAGFVGRNLVENLKNIRDKKNSTRPSLIIEEIYEYDCSNSMDELDAWCGQADFVFHLAGVNRPADPADFQKVNVGFTAALLDLLKKHQNTCPVMLSSSLQATLAGRFGKSDYALSKRDAEGVMFDYAKETGAKVLVYRFPNLAGKWIRPNYNSAVGTFCYNIANDLPIKINDPSVVLELLFIDDLVEEMYDALEGHPHRADYPGPNETIDSICYDGLTPRPLSTGMFCYVPDTHKASLGEIAAMLYSFHDQPQKLVMPEIPPGSLEKKLFSMYLSYLPKDKIAYKLKTSRDPRGSFTELLKTSDHGQFNVNITKPGITRGWHWHNNKWEIFVVVSGHGLIQQRRIGTDEILEFDVNGDELQAVHILPGYVHNITNLSSTDDLVTFMWANEIFDVNRPDTFRENL